MKPKAARTAPPTIPKNARTRERLKKPFRVVHSTFSPGSKRKSIPRARVFKAIPHLPLPSEGNK
jgi:hypothetical protein